MHTSGGKIKLKFSSARAIHRNGVHDHEIRVSQLERGQGICE